MENSYGKGGEKLMAPKYLMHYGIKRRSGRYPWGSGEDPYQSAGGVAPRTKKVSKSSETNAVTTEAVKYKSKRNEDKEIKESRKLTKQRIRSMSDKEINDNIQRIRNEQTLRTLYDSEDQIAQGKKIVSNALKAIGSKAITDAGTKFATGALSYLVKTTLSGEDFDSKELGKYIYGSQSQSQSQSDDSKNKGKEKGKDTKQTSFNKEASKAQYKSDRAKAKDERKLIKAQAKSSKALSKEEQKRNKLLAKDRKSERRYKFFTDILS